MESKVEARRRALTLYTAFIGWEIVLESASNQNTIAIETTTSDEFAEKAQILNTHIQERESARACARACVCAQTSNDLSALETPAARDVHVDIRASGESVASENKFFTPSSPQMQPPRVCVCVCTYIYVNAYMFICLYIYIYIYIYIHIYTHVYIYMCVCV